MAETRVRPLESGDIDVINAGLREADRIEIMASHGPDTRRTIALAVGMSTHGMTFELEGEPVSIWGVCPLAMAAGIGSLWMLGTDRLDTIPRTLARIARRYLSEVASVYPVLENYVDVRHTASFKLLEWLGCSFDEPKPYGVEGLPFRRFEYRSG